MGRVSLRDIASATGYSPATVSNVLNNKGNVGTEATRIILEAVDRMGYRRSGKLDHVTFAIPRAGGKILDGSPFHLTVLTALEDAAHHRALKLSVSSLDVDDPAELDRQVQELRHDPTGAVVLIATGLGRYGDDCLECFEGCEVPLVVVGGWSDRLPFDAITVAHEATAYRSCMHLVELGHARIGYIGGSPELPRNDQRMQGFRRAMSDAHLAFDEKNLVVAIGNLDEATEAASRWVDGAHGLPTAFVADSDIASAAMLRALQDRGISVPDDVSIIGYGNQPVCELTSPKLTTMYAPCHEVGEMAVRLALHQAADPLHCASFVQVHSRLVERESVRSLL